MGDAAPQCVPPALGQYGVGILNVPNGNGGTLHPSTVPHVPGWDQDAPCSQLEQGHTAPCLLCFVTCDQPVLGCSTFPPGLVSAVCLQSAPEPRAAGPAASPRLEKGERERDQPVLGCSTFPPGLVSAVCLQSAPEPRAAGPAASPRLEKGSGSGGSQSRGAQPGERPRQRERGGGTCPARPWGTAHLGDTGTWPGCSPSCSSRLWAARPGRAGGRRRGTMERMVILIPNPSHRAERAAERLGGPVRGWLPSPALGDSTPWGHGDMARLLPLLLLAALGSAARPGRRPAAWDYGADAQRPSARGCANLTLVLDNWKFAITSQLRNLLLSDHQTVLPDYGRIPALSGALDELYRDFRGLKEQLGRLSDRFAHLEASVEQLSRSRGAAAPPRRGEAGGTRASLWGRLRKTRGAEIKLEEAQVGGCRDISCGV
uniref:Uncharacterized protein n=1 Tax=Ficedula albicollis TaxID=59894 RepID=A0A803WG39_FICAL